MNLYNYDICYMNDNIDLQYLHYATKLNDFIFNWKSDDYVLR